MARIKINDLPKDTELTKNQMKQVAGGYLLARVDAITSPQISSILQPISWGGDGGDPSSPLFWGGAGGDPT